jgi:CrcB protein
VSARGLLFIALGGALGSVARYLGAAGMNRLLGPAFPWGTLTVNIVGSFLIGLVAASRVGAHIEARLFLITGVLGGFTTYSAFNEETLVAFRAGKPMLALLYVAVTLLVCLAAGIAGAAAAR